MNWTITLNSSRSESDSMDSFNGNFGNGVMLFYWFRSLAFPLFAAQIIWWIRVWLPISFDLCWSSAISVTFGRAGTNAITSTFGFSCLTVFNGLLAPSGWIGDYLFEPLLHYCWFICWVCIPPIWAGAVPIRPIWAFWACWSMNWYWPAYFWSRPANASSDWARWAMSGCWA